MSQYPEHEKQSKVKDDAQSVGEFLDFGLTKMGLTLCAFREAGDNGRPEYVWLDHVDPERRKAEATFQDYLSGRAEGNENYETWGDEYTPAHKSIEQILAEYFDIDLAKIEAEKRAMLEALRA